jgi:hypothetical protein
MNDQEIIIWELYQLNKNKFIKKSLKEIKTNNSLVLKYSSHLMYRIQTDIFNTIYNILSNNLIEGSDFMVEMDHDSLDRFYDAEHIIVVKNEPEFNFLFIKYGEN